MKTIAICSYLLFTSFAFAGVGFGNMQGRIINLERKGGVINIPQIKGSQDLKVKPVFDESTLAVLTGKNGSEVNFQTATPADGLWKIRNWKASELKLSEVPELKNALDNSLKTREWQKIEIHN